MAMPFTTPLSPAQNDAQAESLRSKENSPNDANAKVDFAIAYYAPVQP